MKHPPKVLNKIVDVVLAYKPKKKTKKKPKNNDKQRTNGKGD